MPIIHNNLVTHDVITLLVTERQGDGSYIIMMDTAGGKALNLAIGAEAFVDPTKYFDCLHGMHKRIRNEYLAEALPAHAATPGRIAVSRH